MRLNRFPIAAAPLALLAALLTAPACASGVRVDDPWTRATAPGQKVAGGFMRLTADADLMLVGGSSPVSAHFELHTMHMDGGVMVMREVESIPLPKDKTVELKPGGLHIMFIGLKAPLGEGDSFPMTLRFEKAGEVTVHVKVQPVAGAHGSHGGHAK